LHSYASFSNFGRSCTKVKGHASASFAQVASLVVRISDTDEQPITPGEPYTRRGSWWAVSVPFSLRAVISGPPCEKHLFAGDLAGTQTAFSRSLQDGWCFMRILVSACIVAVGCALQPPHARALTANELIESCSAVEQSAQSAPGDTVDISPEGLPCWYYMSAVQNMSALVDSKNERLLALCPPAESTTLDFVRIFLRSAERKNETDVNNPAVLVLHALTKAYPCHGPTAAQ